MTLPHLILWGLVLVVGLPSAWKNPTAGALVLAYLVAEIGLPPAYFVFPDIFTVGVIFAKGRYHPCPDYWELSTWQQLKCILSERTPSDRFIMLSFPLAWFFYSPILSSTQWWCLFYIAVAQFLAAGWEAVSPYLRRHAEVANRPPVDPGPLLIAYPGGGRFG